MSRVRRLAPVGVRQWYRDHPEEIVHPSIYPGRPQYQPESRPRSSDRRDGYNVKAEDIVTAGGAAFAAAYADEAALWVQAGKLANQFNRASERGEQIVNSTGDFAKWISEQIPAGVSNADATLPPRRERKRDRYEEASQDVFYRDLPGLYPGKRPPGYRPGLGPGGTRARSKQKGMLSSRITYS